MRPLAKTASGGELSRIMLSLRTLSGKGDAGKTLVFDEVDTGIGGRVAESVGRRLHAVARNCQVLCVTHLPQIAALGDQHFQVSKAVSGERTTTRVIPLDEDARIAELSQMLGGASTNASRANARDLLTRAESWKRERLAQDVTA